MPDQPSPIEPTDAARRPRGRDGRPERLWRHLLGGRLRALRRSRHESLHAVALRANLSTQYLSEVERGTKEPSSEVVAAIGAALDTSLLDLTEAVAEQLRADRAGDAATTRRGQVALAA
jgi:transcriptional regulator with XRE-family HTH domain